MMNKDEAQISRMKKEISCRRVDNKLREEVISLLKQNQLPVDDLDEEKLLFAFFFQDVFAGCGGLEIFGENALIRSVALREDLRGKGMGALIYEQLEQIAKDKGCQKLFLLTTTAESFFQHAGFLKADRDLAPIDIRNTQEFSTICPSSAIFMKKEISA
jgi:amino-acid N-acetyltransferase